MRYDEHGPAEGRLVAPPAVRFRIVVPGALAAAEHPPAHDKGARPLLGRADDLVVRVRVAAFESVLASPALEPDDPLMQLLTALAERLVQGRVRPGDEAVERHRDVEKGLHGR